MFITADTTLYAQWQLILGERKSYIVHKDEPPVVLASSKDGSHHYYFLHIGYIEWVPISYGTSVYYNGGSSPITISFSKNNITTDTVKQSVQQAYNNAVTTTASLKATLSTEMKVGSDAIGASVKVAASLESGLSTAVTKGYSTQNTYESTSAVTTSYTTTETMTIGGGTEPIGWYRHTLFANCDVYLTLTMNSDNSKVIGAVTSLVARPSEYHKDFDFTENGTFAQTSDSGKLEIDPDIYKPLLPTPTKQVFPLDVWGGKLTYSYTVVSGGTIHYELTGGGAGGAGAVAVKNAHWLWGDDCYGVDAGWSAAGGPTILKVNGTEKARANGGLGVNGPNFGSTLNTEHSSNGVKGKDGEKKEDQSVTVSAGQTITIEVGWGGGGSGGVANNDVIKVSISSGSAVETSGSVQSIKEAPGTRADASRGGYGALHYQKTGNTAYTDTKYGEDSPVVNGTEWAQGGGRPVDDQARKGQGGAGGDELRTGGMYASGGGGGAAGGFTIFEDSTAIIEEY
jgi:hypothetical protein